jgi:SAM-dependent methyltransferase
VNDIRTIFYNLEKVSDKWDTYFDVYEKHLSRFRDKSPTILEIGVQRGGSIEMWQKYLGKGTKVIGIDILPECQSLQYDGDVDIIIGDQSSESFWDDVLSKYGEFDIVIDDGGHTMMQQIVTINRVFPKVRDGGVFICEDTHTSYWSDWGGQFNKKGTFLDYAKELTDYINKEHIQKGFISKKKIDIFEDKLNSISFYNSAVVFEKQTVKPFKRVFSYDGMPND